MLHVQTKSLSLQKIGQIGKLTTVPTSSCITSIHRDIRILPPTLMMVIWSQIAMASSKTKNTNIILTTTVDHHHLENKRKIPFSYLCDEVVLFGQGLLCLDIYCCTLFFLARKKGVLFWEFSTIVAFFVAKT